jgi:2-oxoglutarate ferredoxin oxidoreductase subunit alpha
VRSSGHKVAHAHLTHLNPFPKNLGDVLKNRNHILVPEMNTGQLSLMLRAEYLVDAKPISKVAGQPFTAGELEQTILTYVEEKSTT